MIDSRKAGSVAPFANRDKLMKQNHTAEPYPRLYLAVTAYLNIIAHNKFIFKHTIMTYVYPHHKKVVVAHLR